MTKSHSLAVKLLQNLHRFHSQPPHHFSTVSQHQKWTFSFLNRPSLAGRKLGNDRAFQTRALSHSTYSDSPPASQSEPSTTSDNQSAFKQDQSLENSLIHDGAAGPSPTISTKSTKKHNRQKNGFASHGAGQGPAKSSSKRKDALNDWISTGIKPQKKLESWQIQKDKLKKKFPAGWSPPKKLSPDAIEGIRHLNSVDPERFTTPVLAEQFKVSPEAIRRILKSKWRPSESESEDRQKRWEKRHDRIWSHLSELGLRPKNKRSEPLTDARTLLYGQNHNQDGKTAK